uniref:ParD-like antitoxin of type II toxin-antitoxin system n=1 Tax=Methylophaga nitratireducenticrescens TaxID=754476 RepID=I1XGN9_METNJ
MLFFILLGRHASQVDDERKKKQQITGTLHMNRDFLKDVQTRAEINKLSLAEQIERWARIGRIAEDNPELNFEFIKDALASTTELEQGKVTKYERKTHKNRKT